MSVQEIKMIKTLINQAKDLDKTITGILSNAIQSGNKSTQYSSNKTMGHIYNNIAQAALNLMPHASFYKMDVESMKSWANTLWPQAKAIFESILISTRMLIRTLESNIDYGCII
jgi:hypothetical protein